MRFRKRGTREKGEKSNVTLKEVIQRRRNQAHVDLRRTRERRANVTLGLKQRDLEEEEKRSSST